MLWLWIGFIAFVLAMLALDLGVFHRRAHVVSIREALTWTAVWVCLSLTFSLGIYFLYEYQPFGIDVRAGSNLSGKEAAMLYLTGYVVEQSLSMDNMFVIALIFTYFAVPLAYQHRVLFWGILGALMMRAGMILLGAALIARFHWVLYIFGAFLVFTAGKMLLQDPKPDLQRNLLVRLARKLLPVSPEYHGARFIVHEGGRRLFTPLALALVAVEWTDIIFAVDSIPAIFAITEVPFLVFTSNIFAILGLRSLFFALSGMINKFRYLKFSLAAILALVGTKMLLQDVLHELPGQPFIMLGAIVVILGIGIVASLVRSDHRS